MGISIANTVDNTEVESNKSQSQSKSVPAALPPTIGKWLKSIGFENWELKFLSSGFDDIDFMNGVIDENDLRELGIRNEKDVKAIVKEIEKLPNKIDEIKLFYKQFNAQNNNNETEISTSLIEQWLKSIHLEQYSDTFHKHLYIDFERVQRIWDIELSAVLEIEKLGHRKRILYSISDSNRVNSGPKIEDINADLKNLKSNIQQLRNDLNEEKQKGRQKWKKSRPAPPPPIFVHQDSSNKLTIRDPGHLLIDLESRSGLTTKPEWKHEPIILVTGSIAYIANYLGSTIVRELKGMESTRKSIEKLKRSESNPKPTPEIILSISIRGVRFLNTVTQEAICEHDIKNIHCVCQDSKDLTHFAYITKDLSTKTHYCHVFFMNSTDEATEAILTLGEAFEVAYQMKLKTASDDNKSHSRSRSTNSALSDNSYLIQSMIHRNDNKDVLLPETVTRSRSHSVNDIEFSGK